jgi:CRISPR/Cas system endoribonuclease Cas6 (RAMP superfamily)
MTIPKPLKKQNKTSLIKSKLPSNQLKKSIIERGTTLKIFKTSLIKRQLLSDTIQVGSDSYFGINFPTI